MKTVRFALVMMMFFFSGILLSKETKHQINGIVMDALTYERLPYSKVELLRADSTFISATITPKDTVDSENTGLFVFDVMEKGSYLLRVTLSGYETKYQKFSLVNNRQGAILLGRIKLTKINNMLKEITVTGTKIKMLLHGDTIIYNADAFNMANGSMLDGLISRFPGIKLDKNGNISVNGEFVESLLINGLDFSSSSPKLALENLPAYTVDKVKVFKKESNLSKMMGKDMGNNHFVMDVRLKKEYSVGWICNAEAGIGTKNRYTGKAICMRFSPKSRFILFENINNLNDKRRIGSDAEWEPNDMTSGLMSSKTTGLYYMTSTLDQSAWLTSYNTFTHEDGDDKTWTSNQTYLSGGDSYSKSANYTNHRSTNIVSENQYNIYLKRFFIGGNLKLNYGKNKTENSYYSAVFNSDPSVYFNVLDSLFSNTYGYYKNVTLNKIRTQSESNLNNYSFSTDFESGIRTTVDLIRFNGSMSYQDTRDNTFSLYDLTYLKNGGTNDYRNYYKHHPSQDFSTQFETSYDYCITNGAICPFYKFSHHYNHTEDMLYRLDKLSNRDSIRYDLLPSTADALNDVLDNPNSSYFTEHDNYHSVGLGIHYNNVFGKSGYGYIYITLPLRWINNSIHYHRMNNYHLSKNKLFFEPSLFMDYKKNTSTSYVYANLELKFTSKIPDMVNLIDYRDESDPLNIRLGNSNLKNTHIMSLSTTFTKNINKHQTAISFNAKFNQINHAVAYGFVFDKTNGVTTTKPVNVDGNWIVNANMGYTRTIDSDNHITIDNKFGTDYNHCVDMSRISGENESVKSIVRNLSLNDVLKFDYRLNDKLQFGMNAKGQYSHVTSARKGFTIINAGDFSYGFSTIIELPWHLQFSTDINDFCHRGYSDKAMNTNELIWNTRLTKNLLKGKLMISLDGFDLLGNLSNRQYVLNSQGRTENYTNVIPRYAMLRVSYRFNKNPQNSQK